MLRAVETFLAAICVTTVVAPCWAQTSATDSAAAQALFDEGKRLLEEGQSQAACPKLEESLRLDEGIGTRFQLARCYESTGRSASAWSLYLEVAAEARASAQTEREVYARKKAQEIEPSLNRLKITVPDEAREKGLSVKRNGVDVGPAQWGLPVPVDPGRYTVAVSAPGKEPWQVDVEIGGRGALQAVTIQRLWDTRTQRSQMQSAGIGSSSKPETDDGQDRRRFTPWQWVGISAAGVGALSLGTSGLLALMAVGREKDSGCIDGACPDSASLSRNEDARSYGDVATVMLLAGGALVAGGVALFFMPPDRSAKTSTVASGQLLVGLSPAGLRLQGSF